MPLALTVIKVAAGIGTNRIVGDVIKANVRPSGTLMKVCIGVAKFGLAGVAIDAVEGQIDAVYQTIMGTIEEARTKQE